MVYNCVFWLNRFPHKNGIHKLEFGTYVQTHKKHNNSLNSRKSGAIALKLSGNEQGGHNFLSLHTGKMILGNNWTVLPMPINVVEAVHRLAAASKQAGGITFMDRDGKRWKGQKRMNLSR